MKSHTKLLLTAPIMTTNDINDIESISVTIEDSQSFNDNESGQVTFTTENQLISDSHIDMNNESEGFIPKKQVSTTSQLLPRLSTFKIFSTIGILLHFLDIGLDSFVIHNFRLETFAFFNSTTQVYRDQFTLFFSLGLFFMVLPICCLLSVGIAKKREWKCKQIHEVYGKLILIGEITIRSIFNFDLLN